MSIELHPCSFTFAPASPKAQSDPARPKHSLTCDTRPVASPRMWSLFRKHNASWLEDYRVTMVVAHLSRVD